MSSLNSVLDIAKSALHSTQQAMNVTSHNISNANTPGYTRQRANLTPMEPGFYGGHLFGRGVRVENIERMYDSFQSTQIRNTTSTLNRYQTKEGLISTLETSLNDLSGSGLNDKLNSFFNSFQDVANSPSSYAERSMLLSNANLLADKFNFVNTTITQGLNSMQQEISFKVEEINSYASQIATLNNQITTSEVAGTSANDLRDQRDVLLDKLAEIADIQVLESQSGSSDIYIGGASLVTGTIVSDLELEVNPDNPDVYNIMTNGVTLNERIAGGKLKGILESAAHYQDVHSQLGLLAASLTRAVNLQHRAGYGLDGSTGGDFFAPLSIYTRAVSSNNGGAVVTTASVSDLNAITFDDYEIKFTSSSAYNIINSSSGLVVSSGAYTSGGAITVNGITVTISNNSGAPASGDKFVVSSTKNAARNISVALTDPNKVAASSTSAGLPGNNQNALSIVALKNSAAVDGATFSAYYNSMISDTGTVLKETKNVIFSQDKFLEELKLAKDATSGVSLEEEALNLMKLQRAYEAAAKVLTTADKMLESLLNLR